MSAATHAMYKVMDRQDKDAKLTHSQTTHVDKRQGRSPDTILAVRNIIDM